MSESSPQFESPGSSRWGRFARMIPDKRALPASVLDAVGSTSLVRLRKVTPPGCASVLAKLEWENPTGSMKDRMAQAVIARAEEDGRLGRKSSGGRARRRVLALRAARDIESASSPDAFSKEKPIRWRPGPSWRSRRARTGARPSLISDDPEKRGLERGQVRTGPISQQPSSGYERLGGDLGPDPGVVDAFVQSVGTASSGSRHSQAPKRVCRRQASPRCRGGSRARRPGRPSPRACCGSHLIDGIEPAATEEAKEMAKPRDEALRRHSSGRTWSRDGVDSSSADAAMPPWTQDLAFEFGRHRRVSAAAPVSALPFLQYCRRPSGVRMPR
jgi:hypothetical protein